MKNPKLFLLFIASVLNLMGCQNEPQEEQKIYPAQNAPSQVQPTLACADAIEKLGPHTAISACREQAQNGDIEAIMRTGSLYANGQLGDPNWQEAMKWFMKAAVVGHPQAQYIIAQSFQLGRGVDKNEQAAFAWAQRASQVDYVPAQSLLGQFYIEGFGVAKDLSQGLAWLNKGVQHGHPPALHRLALYYLQIENTEGIPVTIDPLGMLDEAAELGYTPAQLDLAKFYHYGLKVKQNDLLAVKWYLKAAVEEPEAMYQAGLIYTNAALGQQKDQELGLNYLKKAAKANYFPAQFMLANLFLEGQPVLADRFEAIEYLRKGAEQGLLEAQIKLAKIFMDFSVPQYDKIAFYWLKKASEQQVGEATFLLGTAYLEGIGTQVNYEKALEIFTQLAAQDYSPAQWKLSKMYYEGKGVEKNITLAKQWLLPALKAEYAPARQLAILLTQESDETEDEAITKEWINYAAGHGDPAALFQKGKNHLYGRGGFEQDITLGISLLEQAGAKNNKLAQRELGMVHEQGLFGLEDHQKALFWYLQAAQNGESYSQYRLAYLYSHGIGTSQDRVLSYAWAMLAAKEQEEAISLKEEISTLLTTQELVLAQQHYERLTAR